MLEDGWKFDGDESLLDGGVFWTPSEAVPGSVHYVLVEALFDGEAMPDNLYRVSVGDFMLPSDPVLQRRALEFCGVDRLSATEDDVTAALLRWSESLNEESATFVQAGPLDPRWTRIKGFIAADVTLARRGDLREWVDGNSFTATRDAAPAPGR